MGVLQEHVWEPRAAKAEQTYREGHGREGHAREYRQICDEKKELGKTDFIRNFTKKTQQRPPFSSSGDPPIECVGKICQLYIYIYL